MKRLIVTFIFLVAAGGGMASKARAQQGYVVASPTKSPAPFADVYPADYVPPYSYWAAPAPYPARNYVGLGPTGDFAYFGRPYGHAYDFWTWPYLSGPPYYGGALNRYYYPPLGR